MNEKRWEILGCIAGTMGFVGAIFELWWISIPAMTVWLITLVATWDHHNDLFA